MLASVVQIVAMVAFGAFKKGLNVADLLGVVQKLTEQWWGMLVLFLPGQFAMLAAALGAALFSPRPLAERLGFTRSMLPWWSMPLLIGGTLFAGQLGGMLVQSLFRDPGPNLRMIMHMMQQAQGSGLASLIVLVCVVPPFVEETLFRGYVQRRLLQRWHPAAAIATSSLFFVIAHFDPIHVLAVVPLAVWLGVVAWRSDSLWPSMLCHAAQNSFGVWSARHVGVGFSVTMLDLAVLVVTGLFTAGAIVAMRRYPVRGRKTQAA